MWLSDVGPGRTQCNYRVVLGVENGLGLALDDADGNTKLVVIVTLCSLEFANLKPPVRAAACYHAEQIISSPGLGAMRFEPLGSTPFRDDRCTFS